MCKGVKYITNFHTKIFLLLYMPYFFKITDYFFSKEEWLDAVKFAIGDFSEGCNQKNKGDIIILIFRLENDEIHPHKHKFEYISENDIDPSKRIGKFRIDFNHEKIDDETKFSLFQSQLESITRSDIDKLYIHITCKSNLQNIKKMGLLHTVNEKDRIGNRIGGKNKKTKRKHKKNKSKKNNK